MEHPCPKCGHPVEDGKPFCKTCNAPQIRVLTAEDLEQSPAPEQIPEDSHAQQEPQQQWPSPEAVLAERSAHRASTRAAISAGLIGGIGSMFFTPFFMLAAGGICVTLYHRKVPKSTVPASLGFRMGLLAGFVGSIVFSCIMMIVMAVPANRAQLSDAMRQRIQETIAGNPDPVARETMQRLAESLSSPSGLITLIGFGLVVLAVLFLILSGVGGAIGAALFGQRPQEK